MGLFELKVFLQLQKVSMNDNLVRQLIQVLGRKQQGQVTVEEFIRFVRNKDYQEGLRKDQVETSVSLDMDRFLAALKTHMKHNNLTFFTLYQFIDDDQNGYITFLEFQSFVKEVLRIHNIQNIKALYVCFDVNGDNKINVKEFIQKVKRQYHNKQDTELFTQQTISPSVIQSIQQQVAAQKTDVMSHVRSLGKGGSDSLTHNDVKTIMQRMRV